MPRVLVTGGTGVLGHEVVPRLIRSGADARVFSRTTRPVSGASAVHGDLVSEKGLAEAVNGVDAVIHCASDTRHRGETDLDATRNLLKAARSTGNPHLVYISIVGIDRIPYSYYQAKLAAESCIVESGLPWTILRATQFHDLVLQLLAVLAKPPLAVVPKGVSAQPVDTGEVAERLVQLAVGKPVGRAPDMGGPRVESAEKLMRAYLDAMGLRRCVVGVSVPGKMMRAFRAGANIVREGTTGTRTFEDFLRERVRSDGHAQLSYQWSS